MKKLKKIIKPLIFISIGIGLFALIYKPSDFADIFRILRQSHLEWFLLSMALGLLSHYLRAVRWKLLIKPLGYNPRVKTLFYSVMIMYLTNLAIPRSGEVVRCATTSRYEKVPFSALLGTVVTERIIDFIMLFILLFIVIVTQFQYIIKFLQNPMILKSLTNMKHALPLILLGVVVLALIAWLLYINRQRLRKIKFVDKIYGLIIQFRDGLKTIAYLKHKWLFIFYTVAIWALYFIMIYVAFLAFDFTSNLSLLAGLTVFVLASFGMVFPSPGGTGSWHFMAMKTLKLYGIAEKPYGETFAFAAHESQLLMLIVVGFISLFLLSFVKPKDSTIKTQGNE